MDENSPGKNQKVDLIQAWYGEKRIQADLQTVRDFWSGKGRYLVSIYAASENYRQNFDLDQALPQAVRQLEMQARLPGINLPTFFPDWGTISTARYWGGKVQFDSTGGNIFIHPAAQTVEQALRLQPRPLDDPEMDASRGLRFFKRVKEALHTDRLWLRSPDMQGPLNTAGLVLNQEAMFVAMYEQPEQVHTYLEKVTGFLIEYARFLRDGSGEKVCGNIWPYTFFPQELGIAFTEDLLPLISSRLYREFGLPQLERLGEVFGGLHIHCCGDYGRHISTLKAARLPLRAVEFHHPATTIEELAPLAEETVFIPYILLHKQDRFEGVGDYYRWLLANTPKYFRYWFAFADDSPEALRFAEDFGSQG